jgi:D-tyrosyl-tRNA(Tyr) deacylase
MAIDRRAGGRKTGRDHSFSRNPSSDGSLLSFLPTLEAANRSPQVETATSQGQLNRLVLGAARERNRPVRPVLQRVTEANVRTGGETVGSIGPGLLVLFGVEPTDTADDINWLVNKLVQLHAFDDESGIMNRSVIEAGGDILLVSQFTLLPSNRKGTRPSWHRAAKPNLAIPLYKAFRQKLEDLLGRTIPSGIFGADMQVGLVNDGPVTLIIDSKLRE